MKKGSLLIVTCLFLLCGLVYANAASAAWTATIHAEGEDLGGVKEYNVVIGVGEVAETLDAPPPPPEYSVKMELSTPTWAAISRDIRVSGETSYMWVIAIDPHGNMGAPTARTSTLSWDPSQFDSGDYDLRQGFAGTGDVVVADMRATTTYDVTGTQEIQYFTLHFTPVVDVTKPTVSNVVLNPSSPVKEEQVNFTITFSEPMDHAVAPTVTFGDPAKTIAGNYTDAITWVGTYTIATGYDGTQIISISGAKDLAGNQMDEDTSHSLVVDTTKPTVAFTDPVADKVVGNAAYTIAGTELDATSGVATVEVSIDNGQTWHEANITASWAYEATLTLGDNIIKARATDNAGNASDEITGPTLTYETDKPTVTDVTLDPVSPVKEGLVTFTITFSEDIDQAVAATVTFGTPAKAITGAYINTTTWEGTYTIETGYDGIQAISTSGAKDLAGNAMDEDTSRTFAVDTTKPTVTNVLLDPASPVKAGLVTFTVTFSEDMDQATAPTVTFGTPAKAITGNYTDATTWEGTYTIATGYDGAQTISISGGKDLVGNGMDEDTSHTFVVDTTKPTVTITEPAADKLVNQASYTIAGNEEDATSGVATVEVSIDNGQTWHNADIIASWTYDATLALGANIIKARAADNAGNISDVVTGPTLTYETDKPTVTNVVLNPASPVKEDLVTFTVTFNEDMDQSLAPAVTFGAPAKAITGNYTNATTWVGTYTIEIGYDGTQTISISGAQDLAGNLMDADTGHTFVVDTTGPTVTIADPWSDKSVNNASYTIKGTENDGTGSGVANVEVSIDGGSTWDSATLGVLSAEWTATIHAEGQDLGGVKEYNATIGIGAVAETLDAPPAPPEYSVKMEVYTPTWAAVSKDTRVAGEASYMWVVGIDPHGNIGAPTARSSTLSWDPSEFGIGDYELREGFDGTGAIVVADMTTTTSYVVTGTQGTQYFTVVFRPTVGEVPWGYDATLVLGTNVIKARATDNAGNLSDEIAGPALTYEIDKPTVTDVTLNPISPVKVGIVTFTITFSENMNQAVAPTVTFGTPAKAIAGGYTGATTWEGTYTIETGYDGIQAISISGAKDLAGNQMVADTTYSFVVDTTAPITTPTPAAGTYGTAQNVTLGVIDANPDKTFYDLLTSDPGADPAAPTTEYTAPINLPEVGDFIDYWLVYYSVDLAGNEEAVQVAKYTIDTRVPVTNFSFTPQANVYNNAYYANQPLTVNLTSPNNTIYYEWGVDQADDPTTESSSFDGTAGGDINLPGTADAETHYVVKFFARDPLRPEIPEQIRTLNIYVDFVVPSAPVFDPVTSPTNVSSQTIGGNKDAHTAIYLQGVPEPIVALSPETTWSYEYALQEGPNAIEVFARDVAGNNSSPTQTSIVLDTQKPSTSGHDPERNTTVPQPLNKQVIVHVEDVGVGVDQTSIILNVAGTAYPHDSPAININATNINDVVVTFTPPAIYQANTNVSVKVDAKDLAGNPMDQDSYTFLTGPNVAISPSGIIGMVKNDKIIFTATGRTPPYTWTRSPEANSSITKLTDTTAEFTASVVVAGGYTVTVTDAATDQAQATVDVVEPIQITPATKNLEALGSQQYTAAGGTATNDKDYTWSIDNATAGSITGDGLFQADAVNTLQTAIITARDKIYPNINGTATINVYPPLVVSVDDPDGIILIGGTAPQFSAIGGFGGGVAVNYTWSVTGKGSIDANGKFTANQALAKFSEPEQVTIRATDKTDNTIFAEKPVKLANKITVWADSASLAAGGTTQVHAKGGDKDAYNAPVVTSITGNADKGTIDPATRTYAASITSWDFVAGNVVDSNTVTVSDANAATDRINFSAVSHPINIFGGVTVKAPQEGVNFFVNKQIFLVAQSGSGYYTWQVEYKANVGDAWGSPVNIGEAYVYMPNAAGWYKFTVTDNKTQAEEFFEVAIITPLTIAEENDKYITELGDDKDSDPLMKLTVTGGVSGVSPIVTWESLDPDIATLDVDDNNSQNAEVVPLGPGFAVVTATDAAGNKASFIARVVSPIKLSHTEATLRVGKQLTVIPAEGAFFTKDDLTWGSSSDPKATVVKDDVNGVVTAVAPGTATITVTDSTPGLKHDLTATCVITVPDATIQGTVLDGGAGAVVGVYGTADISGDPLVGTIADETGAYAVNIGDDLIDEYENFYVAAKLGNRAGIYPEPVELSSGELVEYIDIMLGEGLTINTSPPGITAIADETTLNLFGLGGPVPYQWSSGPDQGIFDPDDEPATVFTENANAGDTVTITLTDENGITATLDVVVLHPINIASNDANYPDYQAGDTINLDITGGTDQYLISSSDTSVVADDAQALTAVGPGTATITVADAAHPLFKSTTQVTVYAPLGVFDPVNAKYVTKGDGTGRAILLPSGDSLAFGTSGGKGDVTWDADAEWKANGGTVDADDGKITAPVNGSFAGVYTITATDQAGFTMSFEVAVPAKIDPMVYSTLSGGVDKDFTVTGIDSYAWTMIQGLNTTVDPSTAGALTNETTATVTYKPADTVAQLTPFRLKVTNATLDERLVGKTNNLYVVPTRNITGSVYDVYQRGIEGATVATLDGAHTANTDENGSFVLAVPDVPGVNYKLRITNAGYVTQDVMEQNASVVVLKAAGGIISGTITSGGDNLSNVVAYVTVYDPDRADWVQRFTNSVATDGTGDYTISYDEYGDYTIVATKRGYVRNSGEASVSPSNPDETVDITIQARTSLRIETIEFDDDDDETTPMVTKIRVFAEPAFVVASPCTVDLADLDLNDDWVIDTTNHGWLDQGTFVEDDAGPPATGHFEFIYTPILGDDKIGISVVGTGAGSAQSRTIEQFFIVHPEAATSASKGAGTEEIDKDLGGTGNLGEVDTDGDGVSDTGSDAGFEVPPGSLVDPDPTDDIPMPTTLDIFIGSETGTDTGLQSDIYEVKVVDALGRDLKDALGGDIVNDDSPIIIIINYDPERFDPTNYTIYYRERNADGSWGDPIDGIDDGTITVISIDMVNHTITFSTTHLSGFGVGSPAPPPEEEEEIEEAVEEEEAPAPAPAAPTTPAPTTAAPIIPAPTTAAPPTTTGGGGGGDGGCFIATAAYGTPSEAHVEILRQFRDVYLLPTKLGCAFVDAYYRYSPPIANFIAEYDSLRAVVRIGLILLVGMSYVALHTSLAHKILILILMMGFAAGAYLLIRRTTEVRSEQCR